MTEPLWHRNLSSDERRRVDDHGLLDADQRARLDALLADPAGHIEPLRRDPGLQVALARADVLPRLLGWFDARDDGGNGATAGWSHAPDRSGAIGPASVGVEWTFAGTYVTTRRQGGTDVANTAFNGVLALGQRVDVRGMTLMGVEDGRFTVRRHIDWAAVYGQLGLSVNWRAPLGAAERRR